MPYRPECRSAAIRCDRIRRGRRSRLGVQAFASIAALIALSGGTIAQNMAMPDAATPGMDPGTPPMTQSGDVNFFSQDLGTILRLRYNTESYGQNAQGNVDIGTMQVVTMEDRAALFDGQVTLNDKNGVGFNLGVGYRWLNFPSYAMDTGRVDGVAVWADGTHTEAGNFFPQIGVSYESLGEMWDLRSNLYVPVGKQDQVGDFRPTGETGFQGNSIAQLTRAVVDSSYTVGELEVARRLGSERDAWAFAGPYFVTNDREDGAGGRVGVRGYAFPDLLLQVAVTNDDVFDTNATFQLQWFVGRTRTNYRPFGGVPDRLREPFMRNDYVALSKSFQTGGIPLTQPDGSALRIVHIDSNAAAGGDGTFENPYNELDQANGAGSQTGDILFAHSTSTFDTNSILQDNQRLLGEGNNLTFTVNTLEEGTITIPESSPGARSLARPMIVTAMGDAITLADNNEVANFDIDGQGTLARAIAAPAGGAGNPNLNNLSISNTTGDGIAFTPITITDPNDATRQIVRGRVTIDEVEFDNIGGNGINIDSATATDITLPTVTLQEVIAISNVTSTNGAGRGINLENTHSGAGRTATLTNYTYDGGTTSLGALRLNNIDGTFTASASTLTNGSTAAGTAGVQVLGDTDGTLNFQSTFVLNSVDSETAFDINGLDGIADALGGTITMAGAITNDMNRSVSVQNVAAGANVDFNGNITDTGTGLFVNSNSGGNITFLGDLAMTIDTAGATAVLVTDNTGANVDFAGDVVINNTSSANGFIATGGGTLSMPGTVNSISTETGRALQIEDMIIAAAGASIGDVNRTAGAGTNAIQLETNTGGAITVGNTTDTVGQAGTIEGGTVDAIRVVDSANVSITGLVVNNTSAVNGVHIEKTDATAMTLNLNDLDLNGGARGVDIVGGGTGAVTMTINDTTIDDSTDRGLSVDNLDAGTTTINRLTVDGGNVNGTARGVFILNSNSSLTFDGDTIVREFGGDDFTVDGGAGTISFAGDVINSTTANPLDTTGRSVVVQNVTGGSVQFTAASSINDDNGGMLVQNNGNNANISFLGANTFNMAAATTAVTVTNNDSGGANANITFAGLDITGAGTAVGFVAAGGGTLSVTGTNNRIDTENGTGLSITDMTIGSAVDFVEVTVDGATGPANAITLQNLTGGQVALGANSGGLGAGGELRSTGDAIVITDVQNVDIRRIRVLGAGTAAGDNGVEITHTAGATTDMDVTITNLDVDAAFDAAINTNGGSANPFDLRITGSDLEKNVAIALTGAGHFGLLVDDTDVNVTGTTDAFSIAQSGSAQDADITFRNINNFVAADANALFIDSAGASGKTVNILVQDSMLSNNSATSDTADITARQTSLMNLTVQGNTFTNANAGGDNVNITSTGAAAFMRLNLGGTGADRNTAAGGTGTYQVHELLGSDFDVFEKDDTFNNLRNTGAVVPDPAAANFDDLPVPPPLPTVP